LLLKKIINPSGTSWKDLPENSIATLSTTLQEFSSIKFGTTTISNGVSSVSVVFDEAFSVGTTYLLYVTLNKESASDIMATPIVPFITTNKTISGFTIVFADIIPEDGYSVAYQAKPL
jgi:hypothetical protein